jgi:DNA-binding CsgD family transcriptional regulator
MRCKQSTTFTYLSHLQNVNYINEAVSNDFINTQLNNFRNLSQANTYSLPVFFVLDYTRAQYIFFSGGLQSTLYDSNHFLEGGISFLLHVYQPDDFKIFNSRIFQDNVNFLQQIPQQKHQEYVFSYNFRLRNGAGQLISFYQRSTFITSLASGLPLYSVGVGFNITNYKNDTTILHTIEHFKKQDDIFQQELIKKNYFYPNEEDSMLSKREKEVLCMMVDGFCSKEIADKLSLSENTVVNHRKNMLKKTNSKNVASLVAFAIKNRII